MKANWYKQPAALHSMVTGNGRPFCPGKVKIQDDPVAKRKIPIKSYLKLLG